MEMRHQPRFARNQLEQQIVDLDAVQRRQSQASETRLRLQQALAQIAEAPGIIGYIYTGQHDLFRAAIGLASDSIANRFERQRDAWPARLPDGAKGAAVVAAGLHRDE